jgi:hypothetical protein
LNPAAQFSTDGTFGTYDLESVLTHELGHLLGLEHSGMVGATMQPRLAVNGLYTLPAFSPRTLAEDDRAGARALYGPRTGLGAIAGTITYAGGAPAYGAHVWAQEVSTGRSIAGGISSASGAYRIEDLPPGQYRLVAEYLNGNVIASEIASSGGAYAGLVNTQAAFRATEVTNQVTVTAAATLPLNISLAAGQPFLNPRLLGINGQLSTIAVPLEPARTFTIYVGGEGLDQVQGAGISITSPFMSVESSSLVLQQLGTAYPIISFNVKVERDVPAGEYDLRFRSSSGEVAYIAGGLTVDDEGGALLAMPAGVVEDGSDEGLNPASVALRNAADDSSISIDYLSGEAEAASEREDGARRVVWPGRERAGSFGCLQSLAEEKFKVIVEPLLNPSDSRLRFGSY